MKRFVKIFKEIDEVALQKKINNFLMSDVPDDYMVSDSDVRVYFTPSGKELWVGTVFYQEILYDTLVSGDIDEDGNLLDGHGNIIGNIEDFKNLRGEDD